MEKAWGVSSTNADTLASEWQRYASGVTGRPTVQCRLDVGFVIEIPRYSFQACDLVRLVVVLYTPLAGIPILVYTMAVN